MKKCNDFLHFKCALKSIFNNSFETLLRWQNPFFYFLFSLIQFPITTFLYQMVLSFLPNNETFHVRVHIVPTLIKNVIISHILLWRNLISTNAFRIFQSDGFSEELCLISAAIPVFPDAHRKSASEVMLSDHMALEQMWRSADTQAHWHNWHAGMFSHGHKKH